MADVSRNFGRRRAVTRVSLVADAGDIVGLLGPNGAGKSTLIGMLATLVQPTTGTVRFSARSAEEAGPDIRRRIAEREHLWIATGLASSGFGRGPMMGKLVVT